MVDSILEKRAEEALQSSGLTYTIVRPGGLKNEPKPGKLIMAKPDSLFEGSIPRATVGQVCVEALFSESAKNKIAEIVIQTQSNLSSETTSESVNESLPEAESQTIADLFATI